MAKFKSDKQRKAVMSKMNNPIPQRKNSNQLTSVVRQAKYDEEVNQESIIIGVTEDGEILDVEINNRENGRKDFAMSRTTNSPITREDAEKNNDERIREDLEENPEFFDPTFIENQIDEDNLKDQLYSGVADSNWNYVNDIESEGSTTYADRLAEELFERNIIDEKTAEDGEYTEKDKEKMVDEMTDENLENPIGYLQEIYGDEEGIKKAVEIGGIDVDEAIEDIRISDGELSSFDNSLMPDEIDYKGEEWLFESQSAGQGDLDQKFKKKFIDEKSFKQIKSLWDNYHLKELPKGKTIPIFKQDREKVLKEALKVATE